MKQVKYFDDGSSGITNDWYNSVNIKINDENINRTRQSNEKALADFRKLSVFEKFEECLHIGRCCKISIVKTTDGYLTFKAFEIYGAKFLFVCLKGNIVNCYELQ